MGRINNLDDDPMVEVMRRLAALERAAPVGFTEISRGALVVSSAAGLIVRGSAAVTGILNGIGKLLWDGIAIFTGAFTTKGTTRFEGDTSQVGPFHITGATDATGPFTTKGVTRLEGDTTQVGPFHVVGAADITGPLALKSTATLEKNLVLSGADGKIIAGAFSLDNNGTLRSSNALLLVATGLTSVQNNMYVGGSLTNAGLTTGTGAANVYADSAGRLWRASSASRYKIDPEPMDLPDALLDVSLLAWIDLGNAERFAELYDAPRPFTQQQQIAYDGADLTRVPGVLAEEVEAAGGRAFVTYGPDGVIEGVAYDRYALARTQILADQLKAALARIDALEAAA